MASVGKKQGGVPALGWWLMAVGTVRLAFTWSCLFGSGALCSAAYPQAQGESITDLLPASSSCWPSWTPAVT
jgi:hypothetical protein